MAANAIVNDILLYWHFMHKYHEQASLIGKRYVLDIEMAQFLIECENPKIAKMLGEFIASENRKLNPGAA